ncbi:endolytic transglycosylase MltG [Terrimonas alba]|uniref:endolytic transglycosylase MltG n=1 Tax=Terrimonas alba TaxID=3349636 RepID=UPI0035F2FF38
MKRKIILGLLLAVVLIVAFIAWKFLGPTLHAPEKKYFYIPTGQNFEGVKTDLKQQKIMSGSIWFGWASKIIRYEKVKPGRYEIKKGMSLVSLVRMLKNGQQSPVNFVITKLRTKESLASRIGNSFECDSTQMMRFLNNADSLKEYDFDTSTVMAIAMPFTYTIKWNTTPQAIFQHFNTAYKNFWTDERKQKATNLGLTPVQVSTLASIIEEETNSKTDKPNVASVYLNRMAKGMPLQADPTVKFALRDFGIKRVLRGHLDTPSPYNTYINKGLPPGPICTPAVETIDAVLNSPKTDYIYFVANSAFDGTHIFTTNYTEHMKYAKLYQQELNKRNIK